MILVAAQSTHAEKDEFSERRETLLCPHVDTSNIFIKSIHWLLKKNLLKISSISCFEMWFAPNLTVSRHIGLKIMKQECLVRKYQSVFVKNQLWLPDMSQINQEPSSCYTGREQLWCACISNLFIASQSNSLVFWVWYTRTGLNAKQGLAKSWVVRLISKRRHCSAEAKDPILVITRLPTPHPARDSRRSSCVRLFAHQFLVSSALDLL